MKRGWTVDVGEFEPFGCHYLANLISVPFDQTEQARSALEANGLDATQVDEGRLPELLDEETDPDVIVQMLEVVTPFDVVDDPLQVSLTLRGAKVEASPIHAVGFVHHIYVKPGTDATPIAGALPGVPNSDRDPARVVAVVDSGIVHPELLPTWMQPENTRFDPVDVEILDGTVTESHGTFVVGLIRQISPAHTVSIARAPRVPLSKFAPLPGHGGQSATPLPTDELHVLKAIVRLINRHDGERVEALNLSLGAYTCDPTDDKLLVTMAGALGRWLVAHPESVIFAAGGNIPGSVPIWPAAYPIVRGVGAAGDSGGHQVVWDPATQAELPADPRWWITDVAPGSRVVNLSGQPSEQLVVWSGSSFASPIAAASHVAGATPNPAGMAYWWPDKPIDYRSTTGLSFEEAGTLVTPP